MKIYMCIYIYICTYISIYIYIHINMYIYMYTYARHFSRAGDEENDQLWRLYHSFPGWKVTQKSSRRLVLHAVVNGSNVIPRRARIALGWEVGDALHFAPHSPSAPLPLQGYLAHKKQQPPVGPTKRKRRVGDAQHFVCSGDKEDHQLPGAASP